MAGTDVSMKYDSMSDLVDAVVNLQTDFQTLENNLKTLVDNLDNQWQGAAQLEFATAYSKLSPKLSTISSVLEAFAKAVNETAANQESCDTTAATGMSNLSF